MSNKDKLREYNHGLFWIGFLMNVFKNWFLLVPGIALCIIGIWKKPCLYIGLALLMIDIVAAFIEQRRIKRAVETSDNPDFTQWAEIMSKDNWREEMKKALDDLPG